MNDKRPHCGHSVDTLKDLMDERNERYMQRFEAHEAAVKLAEAISEKWRDSANEWRQAMIDREREFLPRNLGYIYLVISLVALVLTLFDKFR